MVQCIFISPTEKEIAKGYRLSEDIDKASLDGIVQCLFAKFVFKKVVLLHHSMCHMLPIIQKDDLFKMMEEWNKLEDRKIKYMQKIYNLEEEQKLIIFQMSKTENDGSKRKIVEDVD